MLINLNLISMEQEQKFKASKSIKQYEVINKGDKSFSGYHALYNSFLLLKSQRNKSLKKYLKTDENRDEFFGSARSEWQSNVIKNRIKNLARYYFEDCLITGLRNIDIIQDNSGDDCYKFNLSNNYARINIAQNSQDYARVKLFFDMIPDMVKSIVNKQYKEDDQENKTTFKITLKVLKDCFSRELKNRGLGITRKSIIPKFSEILHQINFRLEFDIISDCQIKNTKKQEIYNINWNAESDGEFARLEGMLDSDTAVTKPGHWLAGKDLELLIELEKDKGIEIPENTPIFCLEKNIKELFKLDQLKNLADEFRDINYSGYAIFLIYIKERKHWISCFVVKDSDEAPRFLFTDSLNVDRTKAELALTLVSLLSDHVLDISNIEFPSLDLLLDGKIVYIKAIIEKLKDENKRKDVSHGLLLYGAPKTGKFSLAYTIAKLANWKFLYVDAARVIGDLTLFNKTDSAAAITKEELKNKRGEIFSLFVNNIKGQLPMVVFIHGIDQVFQDADSNESKKNMINFVSGILIDLKSRYSHFVYIICTSYLAPDKFPIGSKFSGVVSKSLKLDLPNYNKRIKIINYYINKLMPSVIKEVYNIDMLIGITDTLATMSDRFSCSDLKEFVSLAQEAIKGGEKNKEEVSAWRIYYSRVDFKNRPISSTVFAIPPTSWVLMPLLHYFEDDYRKYLYTFCKEQAEQLKNMKAFNSTSSSSSSSAIVNTMFGALDLTWSYLTSKGDPLMFVITTCGKAVICAVADGASEWAKKNIFKEEENINGEKKL